MPVHFLEIEFLNEHGARPAATEPQEPLVFVPNQSGVTGLRGHI